MVNRNLAVLLTLSACSNASDPRIDAKSNRPTTTSSGVELDAADGVWIYRGVDHTVMDGVNWTDGESPSGGSYARVPDTAGAIMTVMPATRDLPND